MLSFLNLTSTSSSAYSLLAKIMTIVAIFGLFMLAGICYWLMVEVIQSGLIHTFDISKTIAYLIAMAVSWLPIAWLLLRLIGQDKSYLNQLHQHHKDNNKVDTLDDEKPLAHSACHIEHTPVYQDFKPKFQ